MFVTGDTLVSFLAPLMTCTTHLYHTPEEDLVLRANGRLRALRSSRMRDRRSRVSRERRLYWPQTRGAGFARRLDHHAFVEVVYALCRPERHAPQDGLPVESRRVSVARRGLPGPRCAAVRHTRRVRPGAAVGQGATRGAWLAFPARSVVDPDLAALIRQAWSGTHGLIAGQIRSAEQSGEVPTDLDPNWEAVALVSLPDGLVSHLTVGHYSGEEVLTVVDAQLDRLFG